MPRLPQIGSPRQPSLVQHGSPLPPPPFPPLLLSPRRLLAQLANSPRGNGGVLGHSQQPQPGTIEFYEHLAALSPRKVVPLPTPGRGGCWPVDDDRREANRRRLSQRRAVAQQLVAAAAADTAKRRLVERQRRAAETRRQRAAAVQVQAASRGMLRRRELAAQRRDGAAIALQARHRGRAQRRAVADHKHEHLEAMRARASALLARNASFLDDYFRDAEARLRREEASHAAPSTAVDSSLLLVPSWEEEEVWTVPIDEVCALEPEADAQTKAMGRAAFTERPLAQHAVVAERAAAQSAVRQRVDKRTLARDCTPGTIVGGEAIASSSAAPVGRRIRHAGSCTVPPGEHEATAGAAIEARMAAVQVQAASRGMLLRRELAGQQSTAVTGLRDGAAVTLQARSRGMAQRRATSQRVRSQPQGTSILAAQHPPAAGVSRPVLRSCEPGRAPLGGGAGAPTALSPAVPSAAVSGVALACACDRIDAATVREHTSDDKAARASGPATADARPSPPFRAIVHSPSAKAVSENRRKAHAEGASHLDAAGSDAMLPGGTAVRCGDR